MLPEGIDSPKESSDGESVALPFETPSHQTTSDMGSLGRREALDYFDHQQSSNDDDDLKPPAVADDKRLPDLTLSGQAQHRHLFLRLLSNSSIFMIIKCSSVRDTHMVYAI